VGHDASTELGRETEALLSVRDGAALSHWSAAALWGLWTPPPPSWRSPWTMRRAVNPGVRVHCSRILERRDLWIRKGLPTSRGHSPAAGS